MTDWFETTVGNCLEPLALQKTRKVLSRDYKSSGSFPIVDQGQRLIAGWTDDEAGLISNHLPVVVFGDHTRAFKYVDFPFVRGADGTQVLKPIAGIDPLFFYYACRAIELPSRGYNRHFKTLREQEIPKPPLQEQRSIAQALRRIDDALSIQDKQLQTSLALKRAAMHTLFTRGLRGEAQKETEVGPVPEGWDVVPLENCAIVQTGAAKGRKFGGAEVVQVPYLRVANVQDGYLDLAEIKTISIRRSELNRYRLQQGDVLMTEGGDFDKLGRGFVWRGQLKLCVHQNHVFAVRTDRNRLLPDFFTYEAQSDYGKAYFLKVAHKTTNLASINSTKLKAFPVLIPTLGEQREIVSILEAIDCKADLHRRKRAVLEELFKALLHKLMTGEIRVEELDISVLLGYNTQSKDAERIGSRV